MQIEFSIPMKPFSINAQTFTDKRNKTPEAKAWEREFYGYLAMVPELALFASKIKAGCSVQTEITCTWPVAIYFNKSGDISSKTMDITNCEKLIQDCLFRHMDKNDKYVTRMVSTKEPGQHFSIRVKLEVIG